MLSQNGAVEQTRTMLKWRGVERDHLRKLHRYLRGKQNLPVVPSGVPREVRRLAEMSRVNILDLVISAVAQSLYVEGYREDREAEDAPAWEVWQSNRMDARQTAVHRGALAYGVSYVTVLPGDTAPVLKGYSPRKLTAIYGDDEDWPVAALVAEPGGAGWNFRLVDAEAVYYLSAASELDDATLTFIESRQHDLGVCPVVRFLNTMELDDEVQGEIEKLIPIQDQIDSTTFQLLVAQNFGAFRQRYILGWTAESEEATLKASAARIWTFEDSKDDVQVGEFGQTDLNGYLDSREASLRHAATLSQTPAHELLGQMVNLSAEALVAAEASQRRKVTERQKSFGESWEQALGLAGRIDGVEVSANAQVRWSDTESRALASTVDALGKMAQMLGIPVQELWERIPGVSQQDIERWKTAYAQGDPLTNLEALLDRQADAA